MHLSTIVCVAIFVCASARVGKYSPEEIKKNPKLKWSKIIRHKRELSLGKQIGNGRVFGSLGRNDEGLYVKTGYKHEFFNDHRGKLEGQAYGTLVQGWWMLPKRHLGARLDWTHKDANATVEISKPSGGNMSVSATGVGDWNLYNDTLLQAAGSLNHSGGGRPQVAVKAELRHNL